MAVICNARFYNDYAVFENCVQSPLSISRRESSIHVLEWLDSIIALHFKARFRCGNRKKPAGARSRKYGG